MKLSNQTSAVIIIFISMLISSCDSGTSSYNYNQGNLPDQPVNLSDFNSPYDDYNATAPSLGKLIPFCFSSNRKSEGGQFDIIYQPMNINFDRTTGILKVTNKYDNWSVFAPEMNMIQNSLIMINSDGNEFGPYLLYNWNYQLDQEEFIMLCATDIDGNFDIIYTYNDGELQFSGHQKVAFLNSPADELYPSYNKDFSKIYFCSNRAGEKFDIYYTSIDNGEAVMTDILSDTAQYDILVNSVLSSDFDDKCPYIFEDVLVFTSNRPGGYGGFDLYFSKFENGNWTSPQNFGSKINTEFDEYRPILFEEDVDPVKNMMVFSSNRGGGLGGFDLYFVGVTVE